MQNVQKMPLNRERMESIVRPFADALTATLNTALEKVIRTAFIERGEIHQTRSLFLSLFSPEVRQIFTESFRKSRLLNIRNRLLQRLNEKNMRTSFPELEHYHLLTGLMEDLPDLFRQMILLYSGEDNEYDVSVRRLTRFDGIEGFDHAMQQIRETLEEAHRKIQEATIESYVERGIETLGNHYRSMVLRPYVDPSLLILFTDQTANIRIPNLGERLTKEDHREVIEAVLKARERIRSVGALLSVRKSLIDLNFTTLPFSEAHTRLSSADSVDVIAERLFQGLSQVRDLFTAWQPLTPDLIIAALSLHHLEEGEVEEALHLLESSPFQSIVMAYLSVRYGQWCREELRSVLSGGEVTGGDIRRYLFANAPAPGTAGRDLAHWGKILPVEQFFLPIKNLEREMINSLDATMKERDPEGHLFSLYDSLLFPRDIVEGLQRLPSSIQTSTFFMQVVLDVISSVTLDKVPETYDPVEHITCLFPEIKTWNRFFQAIREENFHLTYANWNALLESQILPASYQDLAHFLRYDTSLSENEEILWPILSTLSRVDREGIFPSRFYDALQYLPAQESSDILRQLVNPSLLGDAYPGLLRRLWEMKENLPLPFAEHIERELSALPAVEVPLPNVVVPLIQVFRGLGIKSMIPHLKRYATLYPIKPNSPPRRESVRPLFLSQEHYLVQVEIVGESVSVSLNVSGKKEGPHPFEGRVLKRITFPSGAYPLRKVLILFMGFARLLRALEASLFVTRRVTPGRRRFRIQRGGKGGGKVVAFEMDGNTFRLRDGVNQRLPERELASLTALARWDAQDDPLAGDMQTLALILTPFIHPVIRA